MSQSFWINPLNGEQIFLPDGWRVKAKIPGARWAVYKKRQLQFYFGVEGNSEICTYSTQGLIEWLYLRFLSSWKEARFCGYLFYKADGAAIKDKSDRFIHYSYLGKDGEFSQIFSQEIDVLSLYNVNFYFQWRVKAKRTKESRDLCRKIIKSFLYDGWVYRLLPGRIWINPLQEKPVHIPEGWKVWHGEQSFISTYSFREYHLRNKQYNCYMISYFHWAYVIDDTWLSSSDSYGLAVLETAQWKREAFAGNTVEISRFSVNGSTGEVMEGYIIRRFKGRLKWALKVWGPEGICEDNEVRRLAEALSATSMPD